jgi:ribosomal protein S8
MNSNYKLADLISFINVASSQHLFNLRLKNCNTNLNLRVLAILERQGVIKGFRIDNKFIDIHFKYKQGTPVFSSLKIVSTPGKRAF